MGKKKTVSAVRVAVEKYAGDKRKELRELRRLAREGQKAGDLYLVGEAYCRLAELCYEQGDLDGILTNGLRAVALLGETEEYELLAKAYVFLGYAYTYRENDQMALECNDKAYRLVRRHRIKGQTRIRTLNNLSNTYQLMGDPKTSIRLLNECLELMQAEPQEDWMGLAMYTLNLADCHNETGETEKAREVLASMEAWIDKVGYPALVCDYWLRFALISYQLGERERGDRYADAALALVPGNVFPHPVYDDLRQLCGIMGKNGDRERADRIFALMTAYAEKNPGTLEQVFVCRTIADYYRSFGEFALASEWYKRLDELNDRRMKELKGVQLDLHRRMRAADGEISKLRREMRESQTRLSLEPMTGLLNRSALLTAASEFIETAARRKQKVGAIFIDIDFFKEYNDTYGHPAGDEIIRLVGRACKEQESANVRFARYGGDEFFGITRGLTDEEVTDIARRVCRRIREADIPHEQNPNGGRLTLSVGLVNVSVTEKTDTIIEIANYADKAVYYAKNAGKNAIYLLDYSRRDREDKNAVFVKAEL